MIMAESLVLDAIVYALNMGQYYLCIRAPDHSQFYLVIVKYSLSERII